MSVFVGGDQIAEIKFFVRNEKSYIKIIRSEEYSELPGAEKSRYEECLIKIQPLTWGKACQLQSSSHTIDQSTNMRMFDSDRYVQMKLLSIIVEWNFKLTDSKGDDFIPKIDEDSVNTLHPSVADFILKEYNERFEYNDTKRKN